MKKFLAALEAFYKSLSDNQKDLLLDSVAAFRRALLSLESDPTIARGIEKIIKSHITALIPSVLGAITSGPGTLVKQIVAEAKTICPTISTDITDRFNG
jgi:hypothetical protein